MTLSGLRRLARLRELMLLGALAVTVVALGSIVARDLRQSARDVRELNTRLSAGLNLIDALQFNTQEVRRILLYALYTSDANLQLEYAEQSRNANTRVEQLLDEPSPLSDTDFERPRLDHVRDAWARYLLVRDEVIGLILEGSLAEGVALDEGQGRARFDEVRAAIAELKRSFEQDAAIQVRNAGTRADSALRRLWILVVSALVASAVGIYLVNRRAALERVEAELRRARDAAEQAARAKTDFLATMSHELRTPLNAVVGIADLLDRTEMSPRQRELMRLSRSSASALLALIMDVLDYSRIEAGSLGLTPAPFTIADSVEDAIDAVTEPAARKGLDLGYLIDDDVPRMVIADEGRVRQVLLNLLSNAVKFTDRGEIAVHVSAGSAGARQIVVNVRDTGRGIPPEVHSMLFQRFSQVDATLSREHGGAGLGLAISERLARLLGGSLTFQSVPGAGSTFTFAFAAGTAHESSRDDTADDGLRGARALVLVGPGIVERQLRWLLSRWGVAACVVTDEAMTLRERQAYDVVIVDAEARERRLFERAHAFAADARPTPPPLVVLRGLASSASGEDPCHVMKPIRGRVLHAALLAACARPVARPAAVARDGVELSGLRLSILVVEDDPANRRIVHLMLEELGFHADEAAGGMEAIERARARPYDVILMDLQMPGIDGLETTRRIRAGQRGAGPAIIALTASVIHDDEARCRQAGMDGYLPKPLRLDTLAETLAKVSATPLRSPSRAD
jgi:signal transduction histidine kinase/CheY-like chemotaxis protein